MVTMTNIGEEVGPMDSSVWTPDKEVGWVLSPQSGLHLFKGRDGNTQACDSVRAFQP